MEEQAWAMDFAAVGIICRQPIAQGYQRMLSTVKVTNRASTYVPEITFARLPSHWLNHV